MRTRSFAVFVVSMLASACGSASPLNAKDGESANDGEGGPAVAAVLCDGSSLVRFAGQAFPWGPALRVAAEAGSSMLLVDGHCQYWSMTRTDGPIRTGTLTREKAFIEAFQLDRWSSVSSSASCTEFATSLGIRFEDHQVYLGCATAGTAAVMTAYPEWVQSLYDAGSDVTGSVRYSVINPDGDVWVMGHTDVALGWPLPGDPSRFAHALVDDWMTDPQIATGSDADALRAVRAAYLPRADSPFTPELRIPVAAKVGASTRYFDLAMRDVIPFEVDGRVAADAFFR